MPDAPTVADTVPGYEASALFGMGAPKNTPKEIIAKLNAEINAILAEPNIKTRLIELGGAPLIQTPEQFGNDIAAETEKWKKVIEGAGIPRWNSELKSQTSCRVWTTPMQARCTGD